MKLSKKLLEKVKTVKTVGCSGAEIEEPLKDLDDSALCDEALENVSGGGGVHRPFKGKAQF